MIKVRPHHLLCLHAWRGHGYSPEFTENTNAVVDTLKSKKEVIIELVYGPDDVCSSCPNKAGKDCCDDDVARRDGKVSDYFNLAEGFYVYESLIADLRGRLTSAALEDLCKGCLWRPHGWCESAWLVDG